MVRRCQATNKKGQPCGSTIILDSGFCRGHDPAYAADRKKATQRMAMKGRDPEMAAIRKEAKKLRGLVSSGLYEPEHARTLGGVLRIEGYLAKTDGEIARISTEMAELEDAYESLLSDYERLLAETGKSARNGNGLPSGYVMRRPSHQG